MFAILVLAMIGGLFVADNQEFLKTVEKEVNEGAKWHYVGPTPIDTKAKQIPLQVEKNDPYILWKLKKEK